jgi:DNA polymerase alpha subunit B
MNVPIEWEQYAGLMFNGNTPDIIITPSDLMLFAKNIEGTVCVNPGTLCKGASAGSYATITVDPLIISDHEMDSNK